MCTQKFDENPDYKLIDFGLSSKFQGNYDDKLAGTPLYMAPEIIEGNPYQ